ncbi:MAG: zf-HC2 domain-containing protein [Chlorobi bacterium]|nr:zf-HC2 domain-containing protein [Chlorobiota bacterium]
MTCEKIEPLLYLKDEELSTGEKEMISEHLKTCVSCRSLSDRIAVSFTLINKLAETTVQPDAGSLLGKIMDRVNKNREEKPGKKNGETIPGNRVFLLVKWSLSVAAVFFSFLLISQILPGTGKVKINYSGTFSGEVVSKSHLLEDVPVRNRVSDKDIEQWLKTLSVENTTTKPMEKLIFEKYRQQILNNALIRR